MHIIFKLGSDESFSLRLVQTLPWAWFVNLKTVQVPVGMIYDRWKVQPNRLWISMVPEEDSLK